MNFDLETKLSEDACAFCRKRVDRCSGQAKPAPGDVTVCIGCGNVSVFTEKLKLRKPTAAELKEITEDPRIKEVQKAIRVVKHEFN